MRFLATGRTSQPLRGENMFSSPAPWSRPAGSHVAYVGHTAHASAPCPAPHATTAVQARHAPHLAVPHADVVQAARACAPHPAYAYPSPVHQAAPRRSETPPALYVIGSFALMMLLAAVMSVLGSVAALALIEESERARDRRQQRRPRPQLRSAADGSRRRSGASRAGSPESAQTKNGALLDGTRRGAAKEGVVSYPSSAP